MYPQLACTPRELSFKCTLTKCLEYPLVQLLPNGMFSLSDKLLKQWRWLEDTVLHATHILTKAGLGWLHTVFWFPPPNICELIAPKAIGRLPGVIIPVREYCLWQNKIWDMTTARSAIPICAPAKNLVASLIREEKVKRQRRETAAFVPYQLHPEELIETHPPHSPAQHHVAPPPAAPSASHSFPPLPTDMMFPVPRLNTSSIPGRPAWEMFIEKKRKDIQATRNEASPADLQVWDARLVNSKAQRIPGQKGAAVFHWKAQEGVRKRTQVDHKLIKDVWCNITECLSSLRVPRQRIYDEVRNEWDICTEFDLSENPDNPVDDFYDSEPPVSGSFDLLAAAAAGTFVPAAPSAILASANENPMRAPFTFNPKPDHSQQGHDIVYGPPQVQIDPEYRPLESTLYYRLGIIIDNSLNIPDLLSQLPPTRRLDIIKVKQVTAEINAPLEDHHNEGAICMAVSCLAMQKRPPSSLS
ncbi:hypothetical protein BJ138DRAFT_1106202 [Hygrophoropsis aurantiaca]|uniref:Uncharacterized protein n=1 Tax=Hygrophoropsis aurantiaca TaxID=72124 RepID=A0ACB7ZWA9_9AGAM|nr:hypothetical protein BJ138DRAFT_1106202 [Hygrophoropsis aurantiaca]